jgi:hypothetical protein
MVIHADHPRGTGEQPGMAGGPTRVLGARHRMPTDEAGQQTGRDDVIEDRALDAGDIGQRTVGGRFANVFEQGRQCRTGHGENDQRADIGGAGQCVRELGGGVEVVEPGCLRPFD